MTISRSDRKVLVGVLVFLILLIVGLAGAVIVNIVIRNNGEEKVEETTVEVISQVQSDIVDMTVDEAKTYFAEKLKEYEGTEYEFYIKIAQIYKFLDSGFNGEALYVADGMDPDFMDEEEKMDYYLALSKIYTANEDLVRASEYENLYWKMYMKIYDGGAGGN